MGCGLGTTTDFLNPVQKSRYLGIDISETAVKEALKRKNLNFSSIDFLAYPVENKFDAIVFNEVLYYLEEEAAIKHSLNLLEANGYLIVSLYRQKKMQYNDMAIWDICRKYFCPIDKIELNSVIIDGRLITWRIEVLVKKESYLSEKLKYKGEIGDVHPGLIKFDKIMNYIQNKIKKIQYEWKIKLRE